MTLPTGSLVPKDPDATAWPRGIDWTDYLAAIDAAETIDDSSWDVEVSVDDLDPLTITADSIVTGNKKTQAKFSGGTEGVVYTATNTITTSGGTTDERSFLILVEQQ